MTLMINVSPIRILCTIHVFIYLNGMLIPPCRFPSSAKVVAWCGENVLRKKNLMLSGDVCPRKISLLSLLDFFINLLQFRFVFILSHEVKKSCFINRQYFLELEEKKLNVSTYEIWKRLMNNTSLCTQKRCFNQSQC